MNYFEQHVKKGHLGSRIWKIWGVHRVQRVPSTEKAGRADVWVEVFSCIGETTGETSRWDWGPYLHSYGGHYAWGAVEDNVAKNWPNKLFHQVEESENIDEFGAKHWDLMGSREIRELAWIPDQRQKIKKEIKFQFCRAGGKGGQNVNKALQNCSTLQRIRHKFTHSVC